MPTSRVENGGKAQVTPATILYTPAGRSEQTIDFHTVVFEDHSTKAQITKYPVQEGLHVSNHSIRNNRKVSIKAVISNIRMTDYEGNVISGRDYGIGATKVVKEALDRLIISGQECKVITNLGEYNPVVFDGFTTRQKAGMVDSMEFTITGEEIIKVNTRSFSAPQPVVFKEITGPARTALVQELKENGIEVDDCAKLSQGDIKKDESFIIKALDATGSAVETVFEFLGNDPVTGAIGYAQNMTGLDIAGAGTEVTRDNPCAEEGFAASLLGGAEQIGSCLLAEANDFVEEAVEQLVETAMGDLQDTIQGAFYDVVTMGSDSGQALATAGLGCIIRGVTGTESEFPYMPGESLPTTEEIMSGNIFGPDEGSTELSKSGGDFNTETLTKIECDCSDKTKPEVDNELVPKG